jgi:hypothetical protein
MNTHRICRPQALLAIGAVISATALMTSCDVGTAAHWPGRTAAAGMVADSPAARTTDHPADSSLPSFPSASQTDFGPRAADPVQDMTY